MKERERIVVSGLVLLMLVTWLGFAFHQSSRFAGSFLGGVFAVSGSLLMLVPLAYMVIKRIPFLRRWAVRFVPMRNLLSWHIYAGVIGPILVIIHTGHKFESALGIALTGMTLIVVVSGFIGRYLMSFFAQEIREKKGILAELKEDYNGLVTEIQKDPVAAEQVGMLQDLRSRLVAWAFVQGGQPVPTLSPSVRALRLADAIADVEYAIASHEHFKQAFGLWLKCHIVLSLVLYVLLGLHIWASIYFGLRWFQ